MTTRSEFSVFMLMAPCRRLQFNLSDMYPVPRLGIGFLSSYLKANGFPRVELRDIIAEREWIPELLQRFREQGPPDLLGISVTILSVREAFEIATAVKGEWPDVRIVVGGPGVGFGADSLMAYACGAVDFFVRGEGEAAMLGLCKALEAGRSDFSDVPSLIWRDSEGAVKENPAGQYRDLNDGIRCDYEALPMQRYKLHPPMGIYPPATMIETTRGCTFPCDFCCLSMPVRSMTPAMVEAELRSLIERYGIREFHFVDPTFTLHPSRTREMVERLATLDIHWSCKTRVDRIDRDLAREMAKSGCYLIAFGVESGDDAILQAVKKKADTIGALDAFRFCREFGIRTTAYLLVGNPEETAQSVGNTIRFVRQLEPDYVLYDILQADPINPLTRRMISEGHFTQSDLDRYYLSDLPTRLHQTTIAGHDVAQAQAWIKQASSDFYVRPKYFYQRIRDLRTIQDAVNLGAGGMTFFKDLLGVGKLWRHSGSA